MTLVHGTEWGAKRHRLRGEPVCEPCEVAERAAQTSRHAIVKPVPEHLEHGYYVRRYYHCECETCRTAERVRNREYQRAYRARKKS